MKSDDYKYSIAQCDVPPERRSRLESYRAKRRQWLAWLDTDELYFTMLANWAARASCRNVSARHIGLADQMIGSRSRTRPRRQ
jgi:hypothetical protein